MALIAAQKLQIAKLQRQVYGQRSERSARLIDQLSLDFEELEASATEDELAAEQAARQTLGGEDDDVVRGTQSVGFISFHDDRL